jgi:diaminopimelate epimerase
MDFTRSHGTANDFVVLADLDDRIELSAAFVRALADRRRGIGGDGVIRIAPGTGGADVFMDHRNADGSTAQMCGNGVRVVAKHVVDHGLVEPGADGSVVVGTRAGPKPVRIVSRHPDGRVDQVAVDMGPPVLAAAEVPFDAPAGDEALTHSVAVDDSGATLDLSVVSMGNPHGVLVVDDVATAPVATLGPLLETHQRFPAKANIGFAQVVAPDQIRLRVWERGVGETAACGTGACAAVVALQRLGHVG